METFRIVRFFRNRDAKVLRRGVTRSEAESWCQDPEHRSERFFDGFTSEGSARRPAVLVLFGPGNREGDAA